MSVLTIDQIIECSNEIMKWSLEQVLNEESANKSIEENVAKLEECLEKDYNYATELIHRSVGDKKLVDLASAVSASVLTTMINNGKGQSLLITVQGDLATFSRSFTLAFIGILHREGVL